MGCVNKMPKPVKPIRVLFHVTHLRRGGGIESSLLSWLAVLDRSRFAPGLSIAFPTDELATDFLPRLPADVSVQVLGAAPWLSHCRNLKVTGRIGWLGRIYEDLLLPQIRKLVFRHRVARLARDYDVIIDYDMSLVRFASGFGKPLIGIGHFRFPERDAVRPRRYRALLHYYQRYDNIVAICEAMREGGCRLFPQLAARFVTLYPGFDRDDIRRRAALPAGDMPPFPYIVTVTRLEETQKDVSTLIRAFALLVERDAIAETLLIVGDGRHRGQLERLALELGVAQRVRFAGFTANPLPLVRQARLVVLSSRFEGLPTALIEALMLGQVIVSSDCPTGPREILQEGAAGMLVPVGDVEAMAAAMLAGLRDDALRLRLQQAAMLHAATFEVAAFRRRFLSLTQRFELNSSSDRG
jgi:glycosyltransferase involved in cell wall biosynthesis